MAATLLRKQFNDKQRDLIDSLCKKLFTVLLVQDGKFVCLAVEHWRYLKPVREAPRIRLYRGKLPGESYYCYDHSAFNMNLRLKGVKQTLPATPGKRLLNV